jgi:hypothetical protein
MFSGAPLLIYLYWAVIVLVHILLAVGVHEDTKRLGTENRPVIFVAGWVWALATLIGGVVTAGIYWVLHHSTLRPSDPKA